ncbi:MAG TPA: cytochrome c [Usitatibacter sp.]|jgi:cytochrome c556|nr:cytochrome c [Usitatibacter sp.]
MTRNKRFLALAVLGVTALAVQAQSPKPEDQIKLRKAAYDMMGYSFGGINAMAEGKRPYDKEEAARLADLLVQVSMVPRHFFGEGTDKGETRAKPEIWTHRADFDAKMDKMVSEAAKLPAVARTGDEAALKRQAKAVGEACGSCHDDFRVKR